MNRETTRLKQLVEKLNRDEKRFFSQYLPLWVVDPREQHDMEYLFALYEKGEPQHEHTEQARRLWDILLATLRLYQPVNDPLQKLYNQKQDIAMLCEYGLVQRAAKLSALGAEQAEQLNPAEYYAAAELHYFQVYLAGAGIYPKNTTPELVEELTARHLELLQKALDEL